MFAVLVLLLLTGGGLALWIERTATGADRRSEQLAYRKDRINLDLVSLSDSLRGSLLDPQNDMEEKRRHDAEGDLDANLQFIRDTFDNQADLQRSIAALREFTSKTLLPANKRIMEQAKSDATNALTEYNNTNSKLRKQRDDLLIDLARQVDLV